MANSSLKFEGMVMMMETKPCRYYFVRDVMNLLGIKESKAYGIIRALNKELKGKGYITIEGRVPTKFFDERYYN